jgi:hypothetical protein
MLAGQAFLGYLAFFYKPAETQANERTSERANEGESQPPLQVEVRRRPHKDERDVAEDAGE